MKKFALLVFAFLNIVCTAQQSNELTIVSYNVRYNNPEDGVNIWENRKEWLCKSIGFFEGDIVGAQEVTYPQLKDMQALLPAYNYVGVGREGGNKGEFTPIFYLKERFELLESNTFWLSDTPDEVGSKVWDAALPRIATWAKFKDREGIVFYVFNTHFDHIGVIARNNSAKLISKEISRIAEDYPIILTGDFNTPPGSAPHKILLENEVKDVFLNLEESQTYGPEYTTNGWDIEAGTERTRIDYIFYKGEGIIPVKYHVLDGQRGQLFISDHFPVFVTFNLQDAK